jgi:serine/threonine protein kinase
MAKAELKGKLLKNNFFLREFIDSGGMADVYRAWDRLRQTEMAVKILHRNLVLDGRFFQMFAKEADLLRSLAHPNIVRLYEFDRDGNDIAFIIMEWIQGENLRQKINRIRRPLSLNEASIILKPICSALNFAHNMRIYHCDVKPANIMLNDNGQVLLTDFGVARHASENTWGGTPVYMAPEQFPEMSHFGPINPRTDVYGLGITLFEMLTGGKVPFNGTNPNAFGQTTKERIVWELQNVPAPSLSRYNVPKPIEKVIHTAIHRNPANRYSSTLEFLQAFEYARSIINRQSSGRETEFNHLPAMASKKPLRPLVSNNNPNSIAANPIRKEPPPPEYYSPPPPVSQAATSNPVKVKGPSLIGKTGEWAGRVINIPKSGITLGRSQQNKLFIREPSVSRIHASILRERIGKGTYIRDENSSLGVYVNKRRIPVSVKVKIKQGDQIQIGHFQIFEYREK